MFLAEEDVVCGGEVAVLAGEVHDGAAQVAHELLLRPPPHLLLLRRLGDLHA